MEPTDSFVMFRRSSGEYQSIMVLDICSSSELANKNEMMAVHIKRRLEQLCRPILDANHSNSFKNTGDGFLATFPDCAHALSAAIQVLQGIKNRNEKTVNPPIRVRVGLHFGRIFYVFDSGMKEIYGNDVDITFRLEGVQKQAFEEVQSEFPEQDRILCTKQFRDEIQKLKCEANVTYVFCGQALLKGILEPQDVLWVKRHD